MKISIEVLIFLCCDFLAEAVLPQLLYALCSGPESPLEHLERQQVIKIKKLTAITEYKHDLKIPTCYDVQWNPALQPPHQYNHLVITTNFFVS